MMVNDTHGRGRTPAKAELYLLALTDVSVRMLSVRFNNIPIGLQAAAAEPGQLRRVAQGVARPARCTSELRGTHGAMRVASAGAGPHERGLRRRRAVGRSRSNAGVGHASIVLRI